MPQGVPYPDRDNKGGGSAPLFPGAAGGSSGGASGRSGSGATSSATERSSSYIINAAALGIGNNTNGSVLPTGRSISMAAGMDEASQKRGGNGALRKRLSSLKVWMGYCWESA